MSITAISFRLHTGQLLKEEIEKKAVELGVKAGCLISIVGALKNANLRMAGAVPGNEEIKSYNQPLEIVSGTGTISKEGCHIHMSVSSKDGLVFGGHLKNGCIVGVTVEIVLAIFDDMEFKRVMDSETGYKELVIQ